MLKISSGVITYSGVTTFLGVKNSSEVTSLLGMIVSLAKVAYFARNIYVKGNSTEDANIEGTGIGAACTKGAYIGDALTCISSAYIRAWDADIGDDFIRDACVGYTGGNSTIKRFGIHLRSFRILELRQYSSALGIGIRAG